MTVWTALLSLTHTLTSSLTLFPPLHSLITLCLSVCHAAGPSVDWQFAFERQTRRLPVQDHLWIVSCVYQRVCRAPVVRAFHDAARAEPPTREGKQILGAMVGMDTHSTVRLCVHIILARGAAADAARPPLTFSREERRTTSQSERWIATVSSRALGH